MWHRHGEGITVSILTTPTFTLFLLSPAVCEWWGKRRQLRRAVTKVLLEEVHGRGASQSSPPGGTGPPVQDPVPAKTTDSDPTDTAREAHPSLPPGGSPTTSPECGEAEERASVGSVWVQQLRGRFAGLAPRWTPPSPLCSDHSRLASLPYTLRLRCTHPKSPSPAELEHDEMGPQQEQEWEWGAGTGPSLLWERAKLRFLVQQHPEGTL